jgi:hypothetical protein
MRVASTNDLFGSLNCWLWLNLLPRLLADQLGVGPAYLAHEAGRIAEAIFDGRRVCFRATVFLQPRPNV